MYFYISGIALSPINTKQQNVLIHMVYLTSSSVLFYYRLFNIYIIIKDLYMHSLCLHNENR